VHKQVGWPLDRRTATRIRIGELWKRHPDLTGKQVIEKLKLGPDLALEWVQKIMNECWKAYAKPKPKLRHIGRRFYNPWRGQELLRKSALASARRALR